MIDVERARADTPAVEDLDYFFSCGAGLMPKPVLEAIHAHLDGEAQIGGYAAEEQAKPALGATYASIARLPSCSPDEIALVENATAAWRQAFFGETLRAFRVRAPGCAESVDRRPRQDTGETLRSGQRQSSQNQSMARR